LKTHQNVDVTDVQTQADIVESILSYGCVVGDKNCIYKDKKSLAKGKMTSKAKTILTKKLVKKPLVKAKLPSKPPKAKSLL
jgi:hypothetical protein